MEKYSICLEPVLENVDFYDRIKIATDLGFDGIEFWDPTEKDMKKIGKLSSEYNIPVVGCTLLNQWTIRANDDSELVVENLRNTIDFTEPLGCRSFILMTGESESKADTQKNILIENLKRMAEVAEKKGVTLLLESLNTLVDHKGYYLDSAYLGYEIVKCVGSERVKLLYDCYHMQIMEGNLIDNITKNVKFTGHIHCAGVPGRNEPYIGEINYPNVLKSAVDEGFKGYIGLEYWPTCDDMESMAASLSYLKAK